MVSSLGGDQLYQLYKRGRKVDHPHPDMDDPRQWATAILIGVAPLHI